MISPATELTLAAELERVPQVVAAMADCGRDAGLAAEALGRLELVAEEVLVNICRYAYPTGSGSIVVRTWPEPGSLTVEFVDQGVPFDPCSLTAPDLTQSVEERSVGGLGIFLVRRLADELGYERRADTNVMRVTVRNRLNGV